MHINLSNGSVGYVAITAKPEEFTLVYPNLFNTTANPGGTLILSDPPPTAAIIGIHTRAHAEELGIFIEYYNVNKSCKKIIFTLIPEAYYCSFKNKHTGLATVSCMTILTHLFTIYGTLQEYEVQENDEMMKHPITADTIFEDFG